MKPPFKHILHYLFTSLLVLLTTLMSNAQLLTMNFTIDSTTTVIGPGPVGISSSAGTLPGGSNGNGLAAQRNGIVAKRDINLDFANVSNYWDVSGLDVALDFQREESTGDFFNRLGNGFQFGMTGGNLFVNYDVSDGIGGRITVNSGNIQSIPNDDTWRRYRFTYDPNSGVGTVFVDGISVWSNDGPDNRPLFWNGSGNFRIGNMMDASGAVEAIFDSISISSIDVLPIELGSFNGLRSNEDVMLYWKTHSELNNDYFLIERKYLEESTWELVGKVKGSGTNNTELEYEFIDTSAPGGALAYRLKQVDYNGSEHFSDAVRIQSASRLNGPALPYPNPVKAGGYLHFHPLDKDIYRVRLLNMSGSSSNEQTLQNGEHGMLIPVDIEQGQHVLELSTNSRIEYFRILIE